MIVALRVVGRELPGPRDVVVRVERHHTVADLCVVVGDHLRVPVPGLIAQRTGRVLRSALAVSACGLVTGEIVLIGTESDVVVDIVGGPDSGTSHVLGNGRWLIGRGAAVDVSLADPTISRRHAELDVSAHRMMLTPIGAVLANGVPTNAAIAVAAGDVVSIGGTQLVIRRPVVTPCPDRRCSRDGAIEFRRTPYRQPVVADRGTLTIGPIPERHEQRRMQMLSIAGPLLAGLVLFAFMSRVEFLALTLLSPVLLVATTLDERRSGRRSRRREITAFRSMLDDQRKELAVMREAERSERLAAAPDLAELARRGEHTALDLWPRGRDAEDFLRLRVGTGTVAARFDVALAGGGEPRLREEAVTAIDGASTIGDVPITVDLADGVFAIHGDAAAVDGVLTSLIMQAVCLHAPSDLVIAAAIAPARGCDWIKWLPHARTGPIPSVAAHVARSRLEADRLVRTLLEVARRRASAVDWREPHLLVVIDAELVAGAGAIAPLLELAPAARMSVVWIAGSAADVPQHARQVLEVGASSRLWCTAPGRDPVDVAVEQMPRSAAERVALALAPVRDVAGGESAGLATDVTLLDVLGRGATSNVTLARWWQRSDGFELRFPIGITPTGPVEIDLATDGPHVLIAGTTGSGKSELLQSAVTAIAARYSPQRVNFLFVDYKGGAATKVFEQLPHTVGYVSNLDASLARRAIVSLRAELERRMALLEGRAKDVREMHAVAPGEALPSLVIVIDEFATLAKQLPEFVTGVIDIAQRGRSLGVHLVLSTQRLSGAVDENIVANTNVRIALRLLDPADSTAMIGSGAAAEIPSAMRGRGVVRVGSQRPVAFQSAYAARPVEVPVQSRPIMITDFDDASQLVDAPTCEGHDGAIGIGMSQQRAVLAAVVAGDQALSFPRPRRPWHEPLASVVALDELGRSGTLPAIGLFDSPQTQQQGPVLVDLERGGGCLIFGSGGAGKTTALRSMALALESIARDEEPVAIVAFDGASRGLAMLRPLPHVVDVATGDDLEAISRHVVMLDRELTRRRQMLSHACAEHLSAYNAGNPPLPRIVVLIDDIGALVDVLGGQGGALAAGETWPERLVRVLVEGRQVGIHGVVTADRRNAVPARLHAAVSNRIVLGHADRLAYADHGVPSDAPELRDLTPGRGWWNGSTVIQIAVASLDHSARGQGEAIERVASKSVSKPTAVLRSTALPRRVTMRGQSRRAMPLTAPLGVEDVTCELVTLDLSASHVAVIGRPRSGKSAALTAIAAGLAVGHELYAVGTAASGLASAPVEHAAFGSPHAIASLLEELTRQLHNGRPSTYRPTVLIVDDLELLDDIALAPAWERAAACPQLRIVAAVDAAAMTGFTSNPVAAALRRSRRMLVLQPDDPGEFLQITGVRLDPRPGTQWVPGRGVLVADRVARVVQVAMDDDPNPHSHGRRTPVRSGGTLSGVTVISTQSIRTAAVAPPPRR